jgi:hypothetical protein
MKGFFWFLNPKWSEVQISCLMLEITKNFLFGVALHLQILLEAKTKKNQHDSARTLAESHQKYIHVKYLA